MTSRRIDGREAWESLLRSRYARWDEIKDRFVQAPVSVVHAPKFSLDAAANVFCIGSCFARNIEEHLIYCGINVLSKQIVSPKEEWAARANGFVNKFTVESMVNEIDLVLGDMAINERLFEARSSGWYDPQLCYGMSLVSLERAFMRRRYLRDEYFARLRQADVVIVTLGLNEVWEDREARCFLNAAPDFSSTKREPQRYVLHVRTVDEVLAGLVRLRRGLKRLNSHIKTVLTVSPVPMADTFTGRDVLVANTLSKSVLRAAADVFAADEDDVDYFPSFDMISAAPRDASYASDCLHVSDRVVGEMVRRFLRDYFSLSPPIDDFNETMYLAANEDVDAAVRSGDLVSGYHHWTSRGRFEGRPLRPEDASAVMLTLGLS